MWKGFHMFTRLEACYKAPEERWILEMSDTEAGPA